MKTTNILMPALGLSMERGNIVKWMFKVGDRIRRDDILVEIETEKSIIEYASVETGTLTSIVAPDGSQDIEVGSIIAVLQDY